jgi:hypothetical protein
MLCSWRRRCMALRVAVDELSAITSRFLSDILSDSPIPRAHTIALSQCIRLTETQTQQLRSPDVATRFSSLH